MKFLRHIPRWDAWITTRGRLNRMQYFATWMILTIPTLILGGLVYGSSMTKILAPESFTLATVSVILIALPITMLAFCAHAKRLHDLGLPAVIGLSLLVVLLGMLVSLAAVAVLDQPDSTFGLGLLAGVGMVLAVVGYLQPGLYAYLLLAPGERGDNKYGPDPREWD